MSTRSKDFFGRLLWIAATFIIVLWLVFAWEASTGLTIASRRSLGDISTPAHLTSTRRMAIGWTIFWTPIAVWCFLVTRERK